VKTESGTLVAQDAVVLCGRLWHRHEILLDAHLQSQLEGASRGLLVLLLLLLLHATGVVSSLLVSNCRYLQQTDLQQTKAALSVSARLVSLCVE